MILLRVKGAGLLAAFAVVLAASAVAQDGPSAAPAAPPAVTAPAEAPPATSAPDASGANGPPSSALHEEMDAEQAKLAEVGRAIARENCARCHAIGMNDTSAHQKAPPFRDVVERYPSEDLAEALAEGIVSGHPDMPVFIFQPPQIEGFIAYLDSLYLEGLPPPPETTGPDK